VAGWRILDAGPTVVHIVPLTSTIRSFHSEVVIDPDERNGLATSSAAQCQHVRSIARQRILATRGTVGAAALGQIRETIAAIHDLP
jgi:mRNA interferase MazF